MKAWVNGAVVDESEATVSAFDHGITVGDGVFETAKVVGGVPFALTRHLTRLAASAYGLGLEAPDNTDLRRAVAETLAANAEHHSGPLRLRITLTGGTAPLGSDRGGAGPTLLVAMAPMAPWPPSARLVLVPWTRNEKSATAGLKTTSYAENVVALAHAKAQGGAEAVFANTAGNLCEGTGSNIFLVLGGEVVTPPLSSGCLAGVTRALLLEWADVVERDVPVGALLDADEVFLTSSTRDVQAVHAIGDHEIEPGPVTGLLAAEFARRTAADVDP
ncbi:MAG: aminotransferase class IV [Spirochaetaceae bacterium]|nr:aminotransferase class IV [Spirochaetaceae bacterium]